MTKIYGIKNCDSMKKAFAWLDERRVSYLFHDYRKFGVPSETLARWCRQLGWQALVNTRGTTWRKLDPDQQMISNTEQAIALMTEHNSVIRRPVIETESGELIVGFDPIRFESFFSATGTQA